MDKQNLIFLRVFGLILILVFFFFLRWNSFTSPFERDEGEYAYSAWVLSEGGIPYRDTFLQKPPLIVYLYLFGHAIDANAVWPARLLAFLFLSGVIILTYLVAKKQFTEKISFVSAIFVSIMLSIPIVTPYAANTENFLLLPLMGAVTVILFTKHTSVWWHWLIAGVLSALALLFKPIVLFSVVFIFCYWIYVDFKQNKNIKDLVLKSFSFIGGGFSVTLLTLIPFLGNNFKYLFEEVVTFNGLYAAHWGVGLDNFLSWIVKFSIYWWVIIPFLALFLFAKTKNKVFWTGFLLSLVLGVFQTPIGHYYIVLMPALAVMVAVGIVNTSEYVKQLNAALLTIVVLSVMLWPFKDQFGKTPEELNLWVYGSANPFFESSLVADKVKALSSENEYVFVAGSEPQIYYYAKRKSPTRFVITYPFIINTPLMEKYQEEGKSDLEKNKPEVIVYSSRQFSGLWEEGKPKIFINYLHDLIEKDYTLQGAYVWNQSGKGYWLDKPDNQVLNNASLSVYKKK